MDKEEAIKILRELHDKVLFSERTALETLHPELKESEDEKIRKALVRFHKGTIDIDGIKGEDILAWLEKQGEHANFRNKIQIGDKVTRNEAGILVNTSQLNRVAKKREKQGEQKPKFRVGDTIKCKYDDRQFTIKSVDLDKGTYTYTKEGCGNDIDYADEEFELVEQKPNDEIGNYDHGKVLDALMSAKKTPESAWSEEDERIIKRIDSLLYFQCKIHGSEFENIHVWLKSLKDRYFWKPKEWEIQILESVIEKGENPKNYSATLHSILEQLKKLKG